jgi:hypothetical protein
MRTFITFIVAALVLVAFIGCGGGDAAAPTGFVPGQTAEAYAYTHGGYVGQAIATTTEDGGFEVTLDEAFLPHSLAIVDIESDEWNDQNTVTYVVRGDTVYVAQNIAYDGTNYVGTTVGSALIYVEADEEGRPAGAKELELMILESEGSMAAWYENIQNGEFAIFTEFGGEPMPVTTTQYGSVTKRGSTYWNFGLGWQGNMDAIEDAAEQYGVSYTLDDMNRDADSGEWSLADATTAATASDFPDYFKLAQLAVARLEMGAAEE